jgi:hypothetical protein
MTQDTETIIMGRIRKEIDVDGRKCWTLFDSGARNSYITRTAVGEMDRSELKNPVPIRLGGGEHTIREVCNIQGWLDGHALHFQAGIVEEIGRDEMGRDIDVLFGALAMQQWGIGLDPQNERLDLSHFTTEFLEF